MRARAGSDRPFRRLEAALHLPAARGWLELVLVGLVLTGVALPVAVIGGLLQPSACRLTSASHLLAARVLIAPALVEELLFRVLPNPHPLERSSRAKRAGWAAASVALYLAAHPLVALLDPAAGAVFFTPVFLILTALLGVACTVVYLRSGSLWPPVALHWAVVTVWLHCGGSGILPL